jgi:phosphoribosylformimino-5-aminoimidazole carboxamide ribotide isomerase
VLCTDIDRDGTLQGVNNALYADVKQQFSDLHLQASGGAGSLADLANLAADGVIIGKALYEGRFSVAEALEAAAC